MSRNGRRRDKRNLIVIILAVAVVTFCFIYSLQDKDGGDTIIPAIRDAAEDLLGDFDIDLAWLFDSDPEPDVNLSPEEFSQLKVHFIDVGQGKSVLIQAPDSTVLIDSGDNGVTQQLLAYLREQSVTGIDLLIATHPHADHIGGMDQVVSGFDIGDIIMPNLPMSIIPTTSTFTRLLEAIDAKGLAITAAKPGKVYDLGDGATLQILAPVKDYDDLNNISIVARLEFHQISFLFTGDIEEAAESDLLESGRDLSSSVLDVAHHGSNSSSTEAFLEAVSPQIAVFSCGIDNSYGHPHREPMERLEQGNTVIYRTDLDGTVIVSTDGVELAVVTEK